MAAEVFFAGMKSALGSGMLDKTGLLFDKAGFAEFINERDLVALKIHFGERGNTAFLSPIYARRVIDRVKKAGGRPFLTDAGTLYVGGRSNAVSHVTTAVQNGYSFATVNAPVIIADGLTGKDYVEVEINRKHFKKVRIASAAVHADSLIALTHFKGHEMTGFAGALKNIGMGLGCRSGKQQMHADVTPSVDASKCKACGKCVRWCGAAAIKVTGERAEIDLGKCQGCGECIVTCPEQAISINWGDDTVKVQEKIAEYALGAVSDKQGKIGFINFIMNITPDCDCWGYSDAAVAPDIGIAASTDPVAVDQASVDLVNETAGRDLFKEIHTKIDWDVQLRHAEAIGLGSRDYKLVRLD
ncbi:MAG: DUF362 domain-containing protein [Thermoleophilia bacterium]